jgi:hypothetical protein
LIVIASVASKSLPDPATSNHNSRLISAASAPQNATPIENPTFSTASVNCLGTYCLDRRQSVGEHGGEDVDHLPITVIRAAGRQDLHVILDNYVTHKQPKVLAWLARHPRFA